jgi:hypothetical protein
MTKSSDGSGKSPPDPRKARLAQALRDNLKRRKAQARERREADSQTEGDKAPDRPGGASPARRS